MLNELFREAKYIIDTIEKHNHQAYFVGGCVRDLLLGRPIGDIDITTSAPPTLVKQLFDKVIPVGIEHGTVIVLHKSVPYEVTTFRMEGTYSDQRHPDSVEFIDKIDKDLERRDFTINALAMDRSGKIIDLFGGKRDIEHRVIRTVGNGYDRFKEDPLRIIRALRFSSQLGFDIDPETLKNMKEVSNEIFHLAVERITKELEKLFKGPYPMKGLYYIKETGVHQYLPIFKDNPNLIHLVPNLEQPLSSFGEVVALFHLLEPKISVNAWIKSYKCSNETKNEAKSLVTAFLDYEKIGLDKWLIYKLDNKYFTGFTNIINIFHPKRIKKEKIEEIFHNLPIKQRNDLCINGTDIVEWFPDKKRGPWIEKLLVDIEKEIVYGKINNRKNEIKDWIRWNPPEVN